MQTQKSSSKAHSTMADLLASHKSNFVSLSRGENVSGTVTKLTSSEILVDVGAKTEAVVLEKDKNILHSLLNSLKVGDKVEVSVLSPESEYGYPIVSLRKFIDDKIWDLLADLSKRKEAVEIVINEPTKGGFLASTLNGVNGFLPNSHLIASDASQMIGKRIKATVLEVNRASKKIIFSQKSTMTAKDFIDSAAVIKEGDTISGKITSIAPFGIFVTLVSANETPLEGFVYQTEVAWERVEDLSTRFEVGAEIKAKVIGKDAENKRVNLSIKRLTEDPFEEVMKSFVPEKKITAEVTKVTSSGISLDLGDGVEGQIKKEKIPVGSSYEVGQEVEATIVDVDRNHHRVTLVPVLTEKPMGYR